MFAPRIGCRVELADDLAGGGGGPPALHAPTHLPSGTDPLTTATAGTIAVGDTAAEGVAEAFARSDHKHALPAPALPASQVTGAGTAGAATEAARADHVHPMAGLTPAAHASTHLPSGTDPLTTATAGTIAIGDAAAVGVADAFARSDHKHALPAPALPASQVTGAGTAGVATTAARSDHVHPMAALAPAAHASTHAAAGSDPVDHNTLTNLATGDVHTQYALLAGRAGGQTLIGGTAASETLTLQSTAHATRGKILFDASTAYDEANIRLGVGTTAPAFRLDVSNNTAGAEVCARVVHGDNTNAASNAIQRIVTGGASGGDPYILWNVNGATTFYAGLDNSDSDKWMLGLNAVVGNTAYLTVDTAGLVGVGTKQPTVNLDVVGQIGNHRYSATAATAPGYITFRARGTEAAPTVVLSGDRIGRCDFDGYDGAAFIAGAQMRADTTEAWAVGANGTKLVFATVANGATVLTDVLTIGPGNRLGFFGVAAAVRPAAYTRNATIVESRTLLASASASIVNNNNVLAAIIGDLQSIGLLG